MPSNYSICQFDGEFAALCRVIGREHLLGDLRYASFAERNRL
jgi:hypothetical protein